MKQNINFSQFCDSFSDSYKDNFSYYGKKALFEYLENYEEDTGEDIELDTVALCCDYTEYENALECATEYGFTTDETDKSDKEEEARLWLEDRTQVIEFQNDNPFMKGRTSGIIIQQF